MHGGHSYCLNHRCFRRLRNIRKVYAGQRFRHPKRLFQYPDSASGTASATGDPKAKHTLEKVIHATTPSTVPNDSNIILDFSVLQEGDRNTLQFLQTAVSEKRTVTFTYTNNNSETRTHSVEPIAVIYRWYAWYLLAYSRIKNDYRTYKLIRMSNLKVTETPFTKEHESAGAIMEKIDQTDSRQYTDILLKCSKTAKTRIIEYLKGTVTEDLPDGGAIIKSTIVENEQFWLGTLLSLGDNVEIIAPKKFRRQLLESAEKIVSLYREL